MDRSEGRAGAPSHRTPLRGASGGVSAGLAEDAGGGAGSGASGAGLADGTGGGAMAGCVVGAGLAEGAAVGAGTGAGVCAGGVGGGSRVWICSASQSQFLTIQTTAIMMQKLRMKLPIQNRLTRQNFRSDSQPMRRRKRWRAGATCRRKARRRSENSMANTDAPKGLARRMPCSTCMEAAVWACRCRASFIRLGSASSASCPRVTSSVSACAPGLFIRG